MTSPPEAGAEQRGPTSVFEAFPYLLRKHRNFMRYERRMRRIYPNWRTGTGLKGYAPYRRGDAT